MLPFRIFWTFRVYLDPSRVIISAEFQTNLASRLILNMWKGTVKKDCFAVFHISKYWGRILLQKKQPDVMVETYMNSSLEGCLLWRRAAQDEYKKGGGRELDPHSSSQNGSHPHLLASLSRCSRNFRYFLKHSMLFVNLWVLSSIIPQFTPITTYRWVLYSGVWPSSPKSEEVWGSVGAAVATSVSRRWHTAASGGIWPNANNFHKKLFFLSLARASCPVKVKCLLQKSILNNLYCTTSDKPHSDCCQDWEAGEGSSRQKVYWVEARKGPRLLLKLERQHHEHALISILYHSSLSHVLAKG